jgi:hypothetical protein
MDYEELIKKRRVIPTDRPKSASGNWIK